MESEIDDELPPGCTAVRTRGQEGWDGTCPCGVKFAKKTKRELLNAVQAHWCEKHPPSRASLDDAFAAAREPTRKWDDGEAAETPRERLRRTLDENSARVDAWPEDVRASVSAARLFDEATETPGPIETERGQTMLMGTPSRPDLEGLLRFLETCSVVSVGGVSIHALTRYALSLERVEGPRTGVAGKNEGPKEAQRRAWAEVYAAEVSRGDYYTATRVERLLDAMEAEACGHGPEQALELARQRRAEEADE